MKSILKIIKYVPVLLLGILSVTGISQYVLGKSQSSDYTHQVGGFGTKVVHADASSLTGADDGDCDSQ